MKRYIALFLSGFLNDLVLTSYYVHADRGHVWTCVGLCGLQQALAIFQAHQTLADVEMGSPEQIKRWVAAALGYCLAAYVSVSWLK